MMRARYGVKERGRRSVRAKVPMYVIRRADGNGYALRRRFAFVMLEPMFQSEEFRSHLGSAGVPEAIVSVIISGMSDLNGAISEDRANLGPGFRIGHSFFVPPDSFAYDDGWYRMIIETEIFPLLEEYWFDDPNKAQDWRDRLLAAAG